MAPGLGPKNFATGTEKIFWALLSKLSLHVGLQIDVIFSTATNPRWIATVQSVLPWCCK